MATFQLAELHRTVDAATLGVEGCRIAAVRVDASDSLVIRLGDGRTVTVTDDSQSCCENRYMRTDDDLASFVGVTLLGVECREAPEVADENGVHEVEFLVVKTSAGELTLSSHNEHNGYYGGFDAVVRVE